MLEIDASYLEGGGQILRTSLALATLLKKPISIQNIRAKRPNPGLQKQHLTAVETLAKLCSAKLKGATLHSQGLEFEPGNIQSLSLNVNIGTAGSVCLLLQTLLPCTMLRETKLRIIGGTDVPFAPTFFHMQKVLLPALQKSGTKFSMQLVQHGFYPKGLGTVSFHSQPAKLPLKPINLTEFGNLSHIEIYSYSADLPKEVCIRQLKSAKEILQQLNVDIIEHLDFKEKSATIGSGIDIIAHFSNGTTIGTNALGKKDLPAKKVGQQAADAMLTELSTKKPVDSHLADQLIPFMALASGTSTIECTKLSNHCLTNIFVTEQLLGIKFNVEGSEGQPAKISVQGVGYNG